MNQKALDQFLSFLDLDRNRAGEIYETLRRNLIQLFIWRGCRDPEAHADETINRVIRKIDEGEEVRDPISYARGVVLSLVDDRGQPQDGFLRMHEIFNLRLNADSHTRFNDNLDNLPSILKSLTRRDALNVNLPLAPLLVPFIARRQQSDGQANDQANGQANGQSFQWLPRLGFTVDRVHQFGAFLPVNGAFRPDLVPDQISLNYNLSADWQFTKWRLGYRFNRSLQNNRQPGRELADLENLVNGLTIGLNPTPALDVNFEVNNEQANSFEFQRADRTLRYAVNTNWRMTPRATFALNLSTIGAGDLARTSSSRTIEGDAQWSYRLDGEHPVWGRFLANRVQAQFFIRYANRFARTRDRVFLVDSLNKVWTLNTGVNLTF